MQGMNLNVINILRKDIDINSIIFYIILMDFLKIIEFNKFKLI